MPAATLAAGELVPWDHGAARFVVFITADEGEGFRWSAEQVGAAMAEQGVTLVAFVGNGNAAGYEPCTAVGGAVLQLAGEQQMVEQLLATVRLPCP